MTPENHGTSHPDPLAVLRAATRPAHEAIDSAFAGGLRTRADYRRYLRALLPLARWLDASWRSDWPAHLACWHDPARVTRLRDDLAALGETDDAPAPAASTDVAEWLGGCYVMEGSALGARLLSRDVDALSTGPAGDALPRGFLSSHLEDSGRWPRFRGALASVPRQHLPVTLGGARQGFALVAAALAMEVEPA